MHTWWISSAYQELRAIWRILTPRRRRQCRRTLALAIVATVVEMLSLALTMPWAAALFAPGTIPSRGPLLKAWAAIDPTLDPRGFLLAITVLFGGMVIVAGVLRMTVVWVQFRLAYAIAGDLSNAAFGAAIDRPYEVQIKDNSSAATSLITYQIEHVTRNTILPTITLIVSSLLMAAVLVAVIVMTSRLALIMFGGLAFAYATVILLTRTFLRRDSEAVARNHARLVKLVAESFGGIRDLIVDRQQPTVRREFARIDRGLRNAVANAQVVVAVPRFGIEALGFVTIAVIAYVALSGGRNPSAAIPALGLLALSAQRLMPLMQGVYQSYVALRSSGASNRQLLALLNAEHGGLPAGTAMGATMRGDIVFDAVGYTYPGRTEPALAGVTLSVPAGSHVGVIGPSGSGKSTLLDLMLGLLAPHSGSISVGGTPLDAATSSAWHAQVAHVAQDVFLIDATVAENIAFGIAPDAIDRDRLRHVAERAQILVDVERLPQGFATLVGERGTLLSGGQRQRIGIARALYKGGTTLILDEATNALDPAMEARVTAALATLPERPTIFTVSHRASATAGCDRFIVLDGSGGAAMQDTPP